MNAPCPHCGSSSRIHPVDAEGCAAFATEQRVQIERTILRADGIPNAHFRLTDGTFLCQVSIWPEDDEDGRVQVVSRGGALGLETAGQVAIALQMAIEWAAEEIAKS